MQEQALLWDVDGVLIDVSNSYRKAIADTATYYIRKLIGVGEGPIIEASDIQGFKLAGGFNNDWLLTEGVIKCWLGKVVHGADVSWVAELSAGGLDERMLKLKQLGRAIKDSSSPDWSKFTSAIKRKGGGMDGLDEVVADVIRMDGLRVVNSFVFPEVVKSVFQEYYLGEKFFVEAYGKPPYFVREVGHIRQERPFVSSETLRRLNERYAFGVVTGRPALEAKYAVDNNNWIEFFDEDAILCDEDRIKAEEEHYQRTGERVSLGKPNPFLLTRCGEILRKKYPLTGSKPSYYVGDLPDDAKAAKAAGLTPVGVLYHVKDEEAREELRLQFERENGFILVENMVDYAKVIRG
ncbi:Haloacid dehalogenase-like hydrolase [uncultured archaeon]|nr:Haloacid dehalogenase-like hydrolase [uncultured archaeon]